MKTTNTQNNPGPNSGPNSGSSPSPSPNPGSGSGSGSSTKPTSQSSVTHEEFQLLLIATADLPFIHQARVETDYMLDVMETVLNLHIQEPVVINALHHFQNRHQQHSPVSGIESPCIETHQQLENALSGFPDTEDGNKAASQYLWANNHWTRLAMLRQLLAFLTSSSITDQATLHAWAKQAEFERDFKGKVKGLGIAVFHWLLIRCGVPSVKPDIWVINFAHRVTGKRISEKKLVKAFAEIAPLIGESQQTIDLTIWHFEKLAMATTDAPQLRIVWWHMFKQQLSDRLLSKPGHADWRVVLDDKEKLRYGKAGVLISNCGSVLAGQKFGDNGVGPIPSPCFGIGLGFGFGFSHDLKPTIEIHQSVWHEGFELEMRVITQSALPLAEFNRLKDWLDQNKPDCEVSNEPSMEIKISAHFALKFSPTTALAELGELANTVSQHFDSAIGEIETYNQTYNIVD